MKRETPMGLSLIICDTMIEDKNTGKKSLIGIFDRLASMNFPCMHPTLSVFVSMTSGRGEYPCEIVCKHKAGEEIAFNAKGKVLMKDPNQVVDIVFNFRNIKFPSKGVYWLQFLVDDVPVMMRQLTLAQIKPQEAE
ncbi:MAG: hypothetical protein U9O87_02685 [Verrucomicrobiota bacterium]|nr:hypothetical protein [Verrucomicrobiota bacterium]